MSTLHGREGPPQASAELPDRPEAPEPGERHPFVSDTEAIPRLALGLRAPEREPVQDEPELLLRHHELAGMSAL
jgi:hypothetical protein